MATIFKDVNFILEGADNVGLYEALTDLYDGSLEEAAKEIFLLGLETAAHRMEDYFNECGECSHDL